jgi:hypothetical protein
MNFHFFRNCKNFIDKSIYERLLKEYDMMLIRNRKIFTYIKDG